jgi:hypothetical protein
MNKSLKTALIIGTGVAVSNFESGSSLRLQFLKRVLEEQHYSVCVVEKHQAKEALNRSFDLILITSYSCAALGRKARPKTKILWFDPYDSWLHFRVSMIKQGYLLQILALLRDVFFTGIFPKREITTFISERDASYHPRFLRSDNLFIIPIQFAPQIVKLATESRLVFTGDGGYRPNANSLTFLNELGAKLGKQITVIGRGYSDFDDYPHCNFVGYVDRADLFQSLDIHLVPVLLGAGIKTKSANPLAVGLRVIASEEAAIGLKPIENLSVVKDFSEFAETTRKVLAQTWAYQETFNEVYSKDDLAKLLNFLRKF